MEESSAAARIPLFSDIEAEQYVMSICILADGLTFSVHKEWGDSPIFHGRLFFDKDARKCYTDQLSELIFAHPFLTYSYREVCVYFLAPHFVLVPPGMPIKGNESLWLQTALWSQNDGERHVTNHLLEGEGATLLASWDSSAYQFLRRTYPFSDCVPLQVEAINDAVKASRREEGRYILLLLDDDSLNLFALHRGNILLTNSYSLTRSLSVEERAGEALFYLGTVWKALERAQLSIEQEVVLLRSAALFATETTAAIVDVLRRDISSLGIKVK